MRWLPRVLSTVVVMGGMATSSTSRAADKPDPFIADPVTDLGMLSLAVGFSGLLEIIINTGELAPQQPIGTSRLSWIDRPWVRRHTSEFAPALSNVGAGAAVAYAVAAPILTGASRGSKAGLVEAIIYAESLAFTWAATNLAKIAVRRPRPLAYQRQEEMKQRYGDDAPNIAETDTALSFFSGHTSLVAAVSATASYMAFVRDPGTARPWVTMSVGAVLTSFVGYQRVSAGKHFPTDVIAGALAGVGIGVLVPHLHRGEPSKVTSTDTSGSALRTSQSSPGGLASALRFFSYQGTF